MERDEIKIILADDHSLVRAGIRVLLEQIPKVKVLCETGNGREALELIRKQKPDIVLLDISMPELNGLEVARRVSEEFPEIGIIILSMHANDEYVLKALQNGASGYLLKDSAVNEVEVAIRAVLKGEKYLAPFVSKTIVENYLTKKSTPTKTGAKYLLEEKLSSRQIEILQLIAEGNSTKEIAHKLNLSVKTVEAHRKQLMNRLEIYDIAGLVRYAIKKGIISAEK